MDAAKKSEPERVTLCWVLFMSLLVVRAVLLVVRFNQGLTDWVNATPGARVIQKTTNIGSALGIIAILGFWMIRDWRAKGGSAAGGG